MYTGSRLDVWPTEERPSVQFEKITIRFLMKHAMYSTPHLECVATLPCESGRFKDASDLDGNGIHNKQPLCSRF